MHSTTKSSIIVSTGGNAKNATTSWSALWIEHLEVTIGGGADIKLSVVEFILKWKSHRRSRRNGKLLRRICQSDPWTIIFAQNFPRRSRSRILWCQRQRSAVSLKRLTSKRTTSLFWSRRTPTRYHVQVRLGHDSFMWQVDWYSQFSLYRNGATLTCQPAFKSRSLYGINNIEVLQITVIKTNYAIFPALLIRQCGFDFNLELVLFAWRLQDSSIQRTVKLSLGWLLKLLFDWCPNCAND